MSSEFIPNEKVFQKNISLWSNTHPKEALLLPYRTDPDLSFCQTKSGELNLTRKYLGKSLYYHSNNGALDEALRWVEKLNLKGKDVVYVFGVGLGFYYEALKPWLRKNRRRSVVFLENDLGVIRAFFHTDTATKLLKDPQASLYYFQDLQNSAETFDFMYWNFIHTQMEVSTLALYNKLQNELANELKHKIVYDAAIKNALVEEYLRYGANFFKNYYANQLYLAESYLGTSMFGKLQGIPAIICGAGPSLSKALPALAELRDKAIIFAGGSSLNALSNAQILPHFGGGIDPNPTQLDRLSTSSGFELPFFYRNRLLHQAFRKIHGPRLYIPGSGGYDVADWFEEKLEIKYPEYLDEGHNIVNFCVQVAHHLGCSPIIFVGMDLGFTGMQSYASGIEKKVKVTKKELTSSGDFDKDALLRTDINGKPLYTLWKWIAEADWIGDFAKEHPETSFVNCTEAGLGFPGVPNMSLEQAKQHYLSRHFDLHNRIHAEIQSCAIPDVTEQRVEDLVNEMYESMKRSLENISILIDETNKTHQQIEKEKTIPAILQSGRAALAETELADEVAYEYILDLFNNIYARVLNADLHRIRLSRSNEIKRTLQRLELNLKRLSFLKDVARVNIGVIELAWRAKELGDMPTPELLAQHGMTLPSLDKGQP